ncbi:MAG TPA: DEAD/DEAH box helicase [Gemmataceae bacterium]|nr:DEAD/DEAH box helicase [Gemmataceae bacterium]
MAPKKSSRAPSNRFLARTKLPHPLRVYQQEGVRFFAHNMSALLADEMGLGKTVQTILAVRYLAAKNPGQRALVVAPRSLCRNWALEFSPWAPNLLVRIVEGNARNRQAMYHLPIPVLIATYEQMRLDTDLLDRTSPFDIVVLDEAQRIKDQNSGTSIACRGIPRARSWALTGTPIENHLEDLMSLFSFVQRQLLFRGIPVGELHARIKPYFLRRTKADVLPELPPILIQDLALTLRGKQLAAYESLWQSRSRFAPRLGKPVSQTGLLALITKLKQACNYDPDSGESVKLEALNVILENLSQPTDKAIVFSQYVQTLQWLSSRLDGMPCKLFHGALSAQERDDAVGWFRQEPQPCVLLVSIKAGGVGLNLQEASTVVLFDRWWNPAVENQAMQRAHRFGRQRPLHVFR